MLALEFLLQVNVSFEKGAPELRTHVLPSLDSCWHGAVGRALHSESRELASSLDFPTHLLRGPRQVGVSGLSSCHL